MDNSHIYQCEIMDNDQCEIATMADISCRNRNLFLYTCRLYMTYQIWLYQIVNVPRFRVPLVAVLVKASCIVLRLTC